MESSPAWTQTAGFGNPFRGLFGPTHDRPARHALDLSFSLAEGYDSDVPPEFVVVDPTALVSSGASTTFLGNASYSWEGTRVQIGASGASALRYYNELESLETISHSAGLDLRARLGGRTTLSVDGSAAYSPPYLLGLFPQGSASGPGERMPASPDYAVTDSDSYSYGTTARLTYGASLRSQFSVAADMSYTDFIEENELRRDMSARGVEAGFSRNVTRNVAVDVGYRFRTGDFSYGLEGDTVEHGTDVAVEYRRPLSATRTAVLRASLGSTFMQVPASSALNTAERQDWFLSGGAGFEYPFSRTWRARATFRRGTSYVPELTEPVLTTGFSTGVEGMLGQRADLSAVAGYSTGYSAFGSGASLFDTYTGKAQVRIGLTTTLATYAEYVYYFYDFGENAQLAPGVPPGMERSGVRVGVMLWVPALRR
jgi:hypothetical protein